MTRTIDLKALDDNSFFQDVDKAGVPASQRAGYRVQVHSHIFDLNRRFLQKFYDYYKNAEDDEGKVLNRGKNASARKRVRKFFDQAREAVRTAVYFAVTHSGWDRKYNWKGDKAATQELARKLLDLNEASHEAVSDLDEFIKPHIRRDFGLLLSPVVDLREEIAELKVKWNDLASMEEAFNKTALFHNITVGMGDKRIGRAKSGPTNDDDDDPGRVLKQWANPACAPGGSRSKKGGSSSKKRKADDMGPDYEQPEEKR
jgi:hypothetical protein